MSRALIGLGSNLGDRADTLDHAVQMLRALPGTSVLVHSRWHRTAPIGGPAGQEEFLNGALLLETSLAPYRLFEALQSIEDRLGRRRSERWAARTLDLDLLLYENLILDTPRLTVPHPRMAFRRFVLEPAAEIAPDAVHARMGWTIAQLLEHLNTAASYVAIAGWPGVGKKRLAQALAAAQGGVFLPDPLDSLAGAPGFPSGPTLATEIELLDRRAALLNADGWPNRDRLTVTDFWFDQSRTYGDAGLEQDAKPKFYDHWETARRGVLAPKLLVILEPPDARPPTPQEQTLTGLALSNFHLHELTTGPVLDVRSATANEQLAEVCAAVEAMK
jgi:2-amino-4-hydroxy-6-hydroxymethyldihydropteridine diphosphokinase